MEKVAATEIEIGSLSRGQSESMSMVFHSIGSTLSLDGVVARAGCQHNHTFGMPFFHLARLFLGEYSRHIPFGCRCHSTVQGRLQLRQLLAAHVASAVA